MRFTLTNLLSLHANASPAPMASSRPRSYRCSSDHPASDAVAHRTSRRTCHCVQRQTAYSVAALRSKPVALCWSSICRDPARTRTVVAVSSQLHAPTGRSSRAQSALATSHGASQRVGLAAHNVGAGAASAHASSFAFVPAPIDVRSSSHISDTPCPVAYSTRHVLVFCLWVNASSTGGIPL